MKIKMCRLPEKVLIENGINFKPLNSGESLEF